MTISGIHTPLGRTGALPGFGRATNTEEGAATANTSRTTLAPHAAETRRALPTEPPPGTDPELWQVLTPEERSFFARARTTGPLTYGPRAARDAAVPGVLQGGRIDVRV